MSHTPGPWTIEAVYIAQTGPFYTRRVNFGEYRFPHQSCSGCARCGPSPEVKHSREYSREEAEANARLIASAPEMLEALKDLPCRCACETHKSDWSQSPGYLDVCLYVKRLRVDGRPVSGACERCTCRRCSAVAKAEGRG